MNFIKGRPKAKGTYYVRKIAWRGANMKEKKPGFWKYHYTVVDLSEDDDDVKIVWLMRSDKSIPLSSDVFDDWEWCKLDWPTEAPPLTNPPPCWEQETPPYDVVPAEITEEILQRFKNGQK